MVTSANECPQCANKKWKRYVIDEDGAQILKSSATVIDQIYVSGSHNIHLDSVLIEFADMCSECGLTVAL